MDGGAAQAFPHLLRNLVMMAAGGGRVSCLQVAPEKLRTPQETALHPRTLSRFSGVGRESWWRGRGRIGGQGRGVDHMQCGILKQ